MPASTAPWIFWAVCSSALLHGLAFASLVAAPPPGPSEQPASKVEFHVTPLPEPQVPESPVLPTEMAARPTPKAAPVRVAAPEARLAASEPEREVDLSGVTLTNESAVGAFSMPVGNGQKWESPLRGIGSKGRSASTLAPAMVGSAAPAWVPLADLSKKPAPPALEAALRSNYPEEARRRGIAGSAAVRARIDADGHVRRVSHVQESFAGFAEACRRTLLGSRWSPPLDRVGRAVATEVRYTCRFLVNP